MKSRSQKPSSQSIDSPCVRQCCLNREDVCLGCFRTLEEILNWSRYSDTQRNTILAQLEQRKQAYHASFE